jgi:hypothetical protein
MILRGFANISHNETVFRFDTMSSESKKRKERLTKLQTFKAEWEDFCRLAQERLHPLVDRLIFELLLDLSTRSSPLPREEYMLRLKWVMDSALEHLASVNYTELNTSAFSPQVFLDRLLSDLEAEIVDKYVRTALEREYNPAWKRAQEKLRQEHEHRFHDAMELALAGYVRDTGASHLAPLFRRHVGRPPISTHTDPQQHNIGSDDETPVDDCSQHTMKVSAMERAHREKHKTTVDRKKLLEQIKQAVPGFTQARLNNIVQEHLGESARTFAQMKEYSSEKDMREQMTKNATVYNMLASIHLFLRKRGEEYCQGRVNYYSTRICELKRRMEEAKTKERPAKKLKKEPKAE